ncbi:ribosome maturation factor RimM [Lacticaseibacillus hulanensis]|uniref:ribosome maturation factor RimM n=1 Tax=Lacticaseibacillus hulanensis TaxID=2493111 RepID=UPI000FDCAB7C|nr:ribosome maturation factor RimM [Lacticaseibacillus hulanensis]
MPEYFRVGKIVNTHGIRGEVRVIAATDFPEARFKKGAQLFVLTNPVKTVTVASSRKHKDFTLLTFEGFGNINDVLPFKGFELAVDAATTEQVPLQEDEFFYKDIIGMTIKTTDGTEVGQVKDIMELGPNDVWVVKRRGKHDLLLPFIKSVVLTVNVADKTAVVDIPEGLDPDED